MTDAKFKFNFKTGDVEIEGSENFVKVQIENLSTLLQLIKNLPKIAIETDDGNGESEASGNGDTDGAFPPTSGASFGEWMHGFKSDLLDIDKALITACYVQTQSSTNDFKTSDVNRALLDNGIKLSNPSRSLAVLADKKYMFQTRKVGKLKFMRVSTDGQSHLATLKREK